MAANELLMDVQTNNVTATTMLLDSGVDPDVRDRAGRTPLMYAALEGFDELVDLLISRKADVNAQDRRGYTALHFAAENFRVGSAKRLLEASANVDLQDKFGNTPLSSAVFESRGRGEIILLLLRFGAKRDLKNASGVSPIDLANNIGNYDVKQFF